MAAREERGFAYAEGLILWPKRDGSLTGHTHAFCLDRKGRVVDPTPGYARFAEYRGFILRRVLVRRITREWTGHRSSVLETVLTLDTPEARAFLDGLVRRRRPIIRHSSTGGSESGGGGSSPLPAEGNFGGSIPLFLTFAPNTPSPFQHSHGGFHPCSSSFAC